jgi:hypothetical protein
MDANMGRGGGKSLLDLLIGIEVGVIAASVTLAWFVLLSPIIGDPWWLIPNLFASHFYSDHQVRAGAGIVTLVGVAAHVIMSGLIGAINGVFTPGGRLFGLGIAIVWYGLCYFFLWKKWAPLLLVYGSQPILMTGWFLFGSTLGWHPWFVAQALGTQVSTEPPPDPAS